MIGQTFGHYRILEEVGAGGMGVVYRAHDEQLERDVAVKVLPSGTLSDETARKHLRKEAMALAKLNHPNIETVYEFGTQDGTDFLVTEYVPGKTLADRLAGGPWLEKEILALGMQIAAALEEAHEHGIVHRDLKPSNIAVTAKGVAKVLDFGLAKLIRPESELTTDNLSDTEAAAGTLPYMPPEQLRGELVDARADVYTLGAVLYEMATNCRAFAENVPSRLIDAIFHQLPVSPRALNRRISPELERIILKCLEKEPDRRFQSAKELGVDLRRLALPSTVTSASESDVSTARQSVVRRVKYSATAVLMLALLLIGLNAGGWLTRVWSGPAPVRIRSIAVLPLHNLSGDPDQEYFADGMTEAMITDLSKISALRVISRTSVMQYKSGKKSLPQIAKELNVEGVIEGSVQRSGDRVRITAQLIYAPTDTHLWAESYDRELRDVLPLQDDVARAIADEIKIKVTPQEQALLASARQVDPEAHELYLKGRYYWNKRTPDALEKGLEFFKQAAAKDPGYASPYAGIADSYVLLSNLGVLEQNVAIPEAIAAAKKALELDDQLAEAHASLGIAYRCDHLNWREAEKELKRAIELDPSYASAYHWYASTLAIIGRSEDLLRNARRAQELDPLSPIINASLGHAYYLCRRYDDAIRQCQKTLEMVPEFPAAHLFLGMAQTQKGRHREAIAEIQKAVDLSDRTPVILAMLGYAHAAAGDTDAARRILKGLLESRQKKFVGSGDIAIVYAGLGQRDEAFKFLEKAYAEGSLWTISLKLDPKLDELRPDQRFAELLRRAGLPTD
jgi:serine/threonine-protein kinase